MKLAGLGSDTFVYKLIEAFIIAACVEEFTKFFFANKMIGRIESYKKIDCMVIFGAVGLGYEIIESLMCGITNPLAAVVRGAFVAHVMYQFIMVTHYFEWKKAEQEGDIRRANTQRFLTFFVPIMIHGMNDWLCNMTTGVDTRAEVIQSAAAILGVMVLNVVVLIVGLVKAKRSIQDEGVVTTVNTENINA